jgi:hypothetical protein
VFVAVFRLRGYVGRALGCKTADVETMRIHIFEIKNGKIVDLVICDSEKARYLARAQFLTGLRLEFSAIALM